MQLMFFSGSISDSDDFYTFDSYFSSTVTANFFKLSLTSWYADFEEKYVLILFKGQMRNQDKSWALNV